MPFSSCSPRSSKVIPDPAASARVVSETQISPGCAVAVMRAASCTGDATGAFRCELDLTNVNANAKWDAVFGRDGPNRSGAIERSRCTVEQREHPGFPRARGVVRNERAESGSDANRVLAAGSRRRLAGTNGRQEGPPRTPQAPLLVGAALSLARGLIAVLDSGSGRAVTASPLSPAESLASPRERALLPRIPGRGHLGHALNGVSSVADSRTWASCTSVRIDPSLGNTCHESGLTEEALRHEPRPSGHLAGSHRLPALLGCRHPPRHVVMLCGNVTWAVVTTGSARTLRFASPLRSPQRRDGPLC